MRFAVCSDTHILAGDNTAMEERIQKMLQLAYGEAAADENYQTLDALLIVGNLTNDGTREEFDRFQNALSANLRSETQFLGVVAKKHDGWGITKFSSLLRQYPQTACRGYVSRLCRKPKRT